jgi:hypothetical protein
MPLDFPSDFDPFALAQAAAQRRAAAAAQPTEEETGGLLGNMLEKSLGGLTYAGKVLDKTFGGRAVRGVLGGNAREALSLIPGSDSLGLTDEADTVSGTDLTNKYGLTTAGDDSFQNQALGFGAEVALDPSTYLGIGGLTKAGLAASKTGTVARGLRGNLAAADPLKSLFSVGLPFSQPAFNFGTGQTAQRVAGLLDRGGEAILSTPPVRAARALLDPQVGGAYNRGVQILHQDFFRPKLLEGRRAAADQSLGFAQAVDPLLAKDSNVAAQVLRQAGEYNPLAPLQVGDDLLTRARNRGAGVFAPDEIDHLIKTGQEAGDAARLYAPIDQSVGLNTAALNDAGISYFARSKLSLPKQGDEGLISYLSRKSSDFSPSHAAQIQREKLFTDVPGGTVQIDDWAKNGSLRSLPPADREAYFRDQLTGSPSLSPDLKVNKQAKDLAGWIDTLPEAHVRDQLPFFSPDTFADLNARANKTARTVASAETVFEGVKRFARPASELLAEGVDHVTLPQLLEQIKLNHIDKSAGGQFTRTADKIIAQQMGLANVNDVKTLALPADIARDITKLGQAWDTPKELAPLLAGWDFLNNAFKTWVTTPFPAFHTRNLISGAFNQWRDNAFSVASNLEAKTVLRGGLLEAPLPGMKATNALDATNELLREAAARDIAFTRSSGRRADSLIGPNAQAVERAPVAGGGTGNSLLGDAGQTLYDAIPQRGKLREQLNPLNVEGVGSDRDLNSVVIAGRKVQKTIDEFVQMGHYIEKRKQGFLPDQAADAVKKYHNDYADLTSFEKNVMRRVVPWYSFSRRSLPPVLEDLATQPGKLAATVRASSGQRDRGDFVPSFIAEGASVPIGGAPEGSKRYVSSFGLPIEDEALKILSSVAQGNATRGLQQAAGTLNPILKSPAEMVFGTQLFSGRKLEDLKPYNSVTQSGLLNEENGRLLTQLLANTPASRFFTTADKFLDERKGTLPTLLNTLTGVRVTDVDESRQKDIAMRKLLEETLAGKPEVRTATSTYIPRDKLSSLDPEQLRLYEAYLATRKKIAGQNKLLRPGG